MDTHKTNSDAFYILRLLAISGVGAVKVNSILDRARVCNTNVEEFLSNTKEVSSLLSQQQLNELSSNLSATGELFEKLQDSSVGLIVANESSYPSRLRYLLGKKSPPILAVMGNYHLLNKDSIGFCGSREVSEKGLQAAYECAEELSTRGLNIVSGYAKGVDIATHMAALNSGGTTTLVLPEGIFHFKIKKELKNVLDWDRVVVVSEFPPQLSWSVRNAMQRNSTICALSNAMILIESRGTGGSIEAGKTSLKMHIPLFAADYAGTPDTSQGNRELMSLGAQPLGRSRETNKANIARVLSAIGYKNNLKSDATDVLKHPQLSLF
jgi:DNA processing protein